LEPIQYEHTITLEDIPRQWISRFELYYPDLPGFPTVYVHIKKEKRIFGFPSAVNFSDKDESNVTAKVTFLSNTDLEKDQTAMDEVKKELMERFGLSNKIGWDDIKACCKDKSYIPFFEELWKLIKDMNGDYLPYGRFYEEIYSIVRFVSAWNPKTGRQSEMRMVYNFMSTFGQECKFEGKASRWKHLNFFIIPTYRELINDELNEFDKFKDLNDAMKVVWENSSEIIFDEDDEDMTLRGLEKGWPPKKEDFMLEITKPLIQKGLTDAQKHDMDRLVDAFNRNGTRASFFFWSIMSLKEAKFEQWNAEFFKKFYVEISGARGIAPKVVACYLQQGFGNDECIPIDIWVETFHQYALGIPEKGDFFSKFSKMGKLERAIWFASQANKTNIVSFFDSLWCTRYGNNGNKDFREANPISCYECRLRKGCMGFKNIEDQNVLVVDEGDVEIEDVVEKDESKEKRFEEKIKECRNKIEGYNVKISQLESEKTKLESSMHSETKEKKKNAIIKKIAKKDFSLDRNLKLKEKMNKEIQVAEIKIESNKEITDRKITDAEILLKVANSHCKFICITNNMVPKKIFIKKDEDNEWHMIDEFSGYLLEDQTTDKVGSILTVKKFHESLPDATKFVFRQIE